MRRLHVAVGVIVNKNRQVCIAQRAEAVHLGGLWEFPGGKLEVDETPQVALMRELREELGITITEAQPLLTLPFDYPEDGRYVLLDFWLVTAFNGEPTGCEGQPVKWVAIEKLHDIHLPEANRPVIKQLQERYCAA